MRKRRENENEEGYVVENITPHYGISILPYEIKALLAYAEDSNFKNACLRVLKSGKFDQFNQSYMDEIIKSKCELARKHIQKQRVNHVRSIKDLVALELSDIKTIENILETSKKNLEEIDMMIAQLEAIKDKNTAFEKM